MKKWLYWILSIVAVVLAGLLVAGNHYVLSSASLEEAIKKEIPTGSSKAQVLSFVQARHPVACDDLGPEVKARLSGLAENMIYRKDVVITFTFSPQGELLSYATKEYLTFL